MGSSAYGQALERHLPPQESAPATTIQAPALPGTINDDHALGAPLNALILLGPQTPVVEAPGPVGIKVLDLSRLDQKAAQATLAGFLGKPISRKLISEIETAVVKRYRAMGHPFVEVSTPEQEIDQGALQVRVVEFHIGKVTVTGASPSEAAHIKDQIRLAPGQTIDSPDLLQDFDWMGRYPFRAETPSFSPGSNLGETNFNVAVTDVKPWQVSAGYSNSGSQLSGWDRYDISASVGIAALNDAVLAAQVTGSPDFWAVHGDAFTDHHPQYESAAARLTVPTVPRQDIEVTVDAVESNEISDVYFLIRQQTLEATIAYRSALSDWIRAPGEVVFGVEAVRQMRATIFGPYELGYNAINVYQFYGEWDDRVIDPFGHTDVAVSVHGSPGGIGRSNTTTAFYDFSYPTRVSATYVFATASAQRTTPLPFGLSLVNEWNGQYAGRALPSPEEIAVGGPTAVRGYSLDDGAFDDAFVARNTLRGPVTTVVGRGQYGLTLTPLVYADAGYGRADGTRQSLTVASVGLGCDAQFGSRVSGGVALSYPLLNALYTPRGALHLDARISVAY